MFSFVVYAVSFLLLPFMNGSDLQLLSQNEFDFSENILFGIPQETDLMLTREGFSVGYSKQLQQALWVGYFLRDSQLVTDTKVKRTNRFQEDPSVGRNAVKPGDYSRTGFDRGHLAPAADMAYAPVPMSNSFFMTNMAPQVPGCNRGIWKRLEKQVRQWAKREGLLYVISGPVFAPVTSGMGKKDIPVPCAFYKVILDLTPPLKMIAFIIPNDTSKRRLHSFVVTVDEVEMITGFDFFSNLPEESQRMLEAHSDFREWDANPKNAEEP